ncbi:MAG: helix-turn-helix domain-containing protein [Pseudacidovorax sp.]|uniref:helix-turn-helix transcriptional regulator n=1 Tax=Pseudacidovorax sp. TaxID=1934311 RepID=UPI001B50A936|nr:helix-turn-helix domain-containing protein [Pseudacidovorax sp.]MBP6892893.1 helix-turn-helix domain-containing protein [Pseudacidovorax sp.]
MAAGHPIPPYGAAGAAPQSASAAAPAEPEFLTTEEAAALLRLSPRTLEKQRVLGGGPRFRKFGARVVYARADLRAYADRNTFAMTSDPGYAVRDSVR